MPEEKEQPRAQIQEVVINNELINNKLNAIYALVQEEVVDVLKKIEKKL